jgi:hypothetical protein
MEADFQGCKILLQSLVIKVKKNRLGLQQQNIIVCCAMSTCSFFPVCEWRHHSFSRGGRPGNIYVCSKSGRKNKDLFVI